MSISYYIDADTGIAITLFSGSVNTEEVLASLEEFYSDPRILAVTRELVDLSKLNQIDVSVDAMRSVAETDRKYLKAHRKIAFLAPQPVAYSLIRIYKLLAEDLPVEVEIFEALGDARRWLEPASEHS